MKRTWHISFPRLWKSQHNISLTISSSSGMRDKRSSTSLFVTACGRMIRLENFMTPHIISKTLIGIKWSTSKAPNNRRAVSQLNSGTEKLKVLEQTQTGRVRKGSPRIKADCLNWYLTLRPSSPPQCTYFLTLSPSDARKPIVFWTVCDTSWIAWSLSLIVFFSSSFLSSSSSSSLPMSRSSFTVWTDAPVIHFTNQFLKRRKSISSRSRRSYDNIYLRRYSRATAGIVEMSPQIQPHTHTMRAKKDLIGLSHSKQDLRMREKNILMNSKHEL